MRDRGGARRGCAGRLPDYRADEPRTNSATVRRGWNPRPPGDGGCQCGHPFGCRQGVDGPGSAVSPSQGSRCSPWPGSSPTRCAGTLTAHHMLTNGRLTAMTPSPVTTAYSCDVEISRQNSLQRGHICLSVLTRLRRCIPRTLSVIPRRQRRGGAIHREWRPGGWRWTSQPT